MDCLPNLDVQRWNDLDGCERLTQFTKEPITVA